MKIWILYFLIFGIGLTSVMVMVSAGPSPEVLIRGNWQEVTWEYERVDKSDDNDFDYKQIPEDVKRSIGENLIIHQAETWVFLPNGKLILRGEDTEKLVDWRIKGRGHILQIKYDDDTAENYILAELTDTEMHLNFETDIQARGIAKLTFQRTKE